MYGLRRCDNLIDGEGALSWAVAGYNGAIADNTPFAADAIFNASHSNNLYGLSNTVTPLSITTAFIIKH